MNEMTTDLNTIKTLKSQFMNFNGRENRARNTIKLLE